MTEFIAVNDNLESCKKNKIKDKTRAKISRLSLNYFQGRVWSDLWSGNDLFVWTIFVHYCWKFYNMLNVL